MNGARTSVVIMVALLAATACSRGTKQPPVAGRGSLADSADQVMFGARFNLTQGGVLRAQLHADTAFFFEDNTRVELSRVNTVFFTSTGARNALLASRTGTYRTATGEMVARGDVEVNSTDGRRLRSPELHYSQSRNEVSSDSAFVLTEPSRRLEGVGFRSDPNLNNVKVLKVVAGSGASLNIPTQ